MRYLYVNFKRQLIEHYHSIIQAQSAEHTRGCTLCKLLNVNSDLKANLCFAGFDYITNILALDVLIDFVVDSKLFLSNEIVQEMFTPS